MRNFEDSEIKTSYTLERHLKNLCSENPEYIDLYATWELDKKTYESILMSIVYNYPHYSLHDHSHSKNIISNIEMVLGEDRIKQLGPTETWMILHSAYLHDFGMALQNRYIESEWKKDEFQKYLTEISNSGNKDLREAVNYISQLGDSLKDESFEKNWPIKVRRFVTEIVSDYFRSKHAALTKEYIDKSEEWKLDLSHNGLIKGRLFKLAGEISFLHGQSFDDVMKLDYKSNGIKSDYIHPRFIAEMIRLGDLLDIDNNRFNKNIEEVFGELPELSKTHKDKHASISHLLITPKSIEISAECKKDEVYREVRNWFQWLKDEIEFLTIRWSEIVPDCFTGYAPKITKLEILLNGKVNMSKEVDLKFNISQEKAFEILEGANIYESKFAFLREFIQNAVDASKIQFWKDIKRGVYDPWIAKNKQKNTLNPFDILDKRIYENYRILVEINESKNGKEENQITIKVKDKGIGISREDLSSISKVGESWGKREHWKNELDDMPAWLKPTGGFGVGLQSAFLVTDEINIITKTDSEASKEIKFISRKDNGYISIVDSEEESDRGTEMHVEFSSNINSKHEIEIYTYQNKLKKYDSFKEIYSPVIRVIIEYISNECQNLLFPLTIKTGNEEYNIESIIDNFHCLFGDNSRKGDNYLYKFSDDFSSIYMWEESSSSLMKLTIPRRKFRSTPFINAQFKGVNVKFAKRHRWQDLLEIELDILGMDTQETLTLNREKIRESARGKIYEVIDGFISFALKKYYETISPGTFDLNDKNLNTFFLRILYDLHNVSDKLDINHIFFDKLKNASEFIKLKMAIKDDVSHIYSEKDISGKELLENYPNLSYIGTDLFRIIYGRSNYKDAVERFNQIDNDSSLNHIVIDEDFTRILENFPVSRIHGPIINGIEAYVYTISGFKVPDSIKADEATYRQVLTNLGDKDRVRTFIPALSQHKELSVTNLPSELRQYYNVLNLRKNHCTISPITSSDVAKLEGSISKELFIKDIVDRVDFSNLVEYTFANQPTNGKYSKDIIREEYKKLISSYYDVMVPGNAECKNECQPV